MRSGQYDEVTDPHRRSAPEPPDPNPTKLDGAPTLLLADQVALGHLVAHGELLTEIRDHAKRSADADVERVALARSVLEGATRWLQIGVMVGGVALGVGGLGALVVTVGWLLLR